jgi:hypothetical protein
MTTRAEVEEGDFFKKKKKTERKLVPDATDEKSQPRSLQREMKERKPSVVRG